MQLDWIDDILAVIDAGSLARAAERRFVTQPAFTRRVRQIEASIGAELFDRTRKPVQVLPGVLALEPVLREASARLRRLEHDLRQSARQGGGGIVFGCQHALATTVSPWILREIAALEDVPVRVRSADRDACLMLLVGGEADFIVTYEGIDAPDTADSPLFETVTLGGDRLVPVCAPALAGEMGQGPLPVILYPPEVHLGRVFDLHIAPRLPRGTVLVPRAQTSLTLAACEYALEGIGLSWLPLTLVSAHLAAGRLHLVETLPDRRLDIRITRPASIRDPRIERVLGRLVAGYGPGVS